MPHFSIRAPDGTQYELDGPEGATEQDALRMVMAQHKPKPVDDRLDAFKRVDADPAASVGAGIAEPAMALASGALATPIAGIAGLAAGGVGKVANMLGLTDKSATDIAGDTVKGVQDAITYKPQTKAGQAVTGAIAYPFEKLAEGGDYLGGKAADFTGSPLVGAGVNTLVQSLPALIAKGAKSPLGRRQIAIQDELDTLKAQNATRDATTKAALDAGYVLPPETVNPGGVNSVLEGIAGKVKTQQKASQKNQPVANNMTRQELGLPETAELTGDTYDTVRSAAGTHYDAIPQAVPDLSATPAYASALQTLNPKFASARTTFPNQFKNAEVESLVSDLSLPSMPTEAAIQMIKSLREKSRTNYTKGREDVGAKTLGEAQQNAANALEGLIEDNLPPGSPLLQNFQAARTQIAKSYAAEKATSNGNIDAAVYKRELAKDKPLTGNFKLTGQVAGQYPKAMQAADKIGSVAAVSPLDLATAAIGHGHGGFALAALRPGIRAMLLSRMYQNSRMMKPNYTAPNYGPTLDKVVGANVAGVGQDD